MGDRPVSSSPAVSSAKKRRLNALHQRLGSTHAGGARPQGGSPAGPPGKKLKAAAAVPAEQPQGPSADEGAAAAFLNGLLASTGGEGAGQQAVKQKVQDRVLQLDNPAATKAAKARQKRKGAQLQHGAPRRARAKELSQLPKDQQRYDLYQPLSSLWQAYIAELLKGRNFEEGLVQADLHGCQLTVITSKVERHVGKQGIVVQDRRNTMVLITPGNQQLILAKRGGRFQVQLDASHAMILNGAAMITE